MRFSRLCLQNPTEKLLIFIFFRVHKSYNIILGMKKSFCLLIIANAFIIAAYSQCQGYQVQVPGFPAGFCIQTCANPLYSNCPANFVVSPSVVGDQYCGYAKVGNGYQWKNFTYACEVCRTPNVVGFYGGCCTCTYVKCPAGTTCSQGNCIADPVIPPCTSDSECTNGQICQSGSCVTPLCRSDSACGNGNICRNGRCRIATCADIKCSNPGEVCENGACFRKYDTFCSAQYPQIARSYCGNPRPTQAQCPDRVYPVQPRVCAVAVTGEFIEFGLQCEACKRTYVQYYYNQPCSTLPKKCGAAQTCVNGACVGPSNLCGGKVCPENSYCNNAVCVTISNYCGNSFKCSTGFECISNRCVAVANSCATVKCRQNWSCSGGVCYPNPGYCGSDSNCGANQRCSNGVCYTVPQPPQPGYCTNDNQCPRNQICSNNYCITYNPPRPGYCSNDNQCSANQRCFNNYCYALAPVNPQPNPGICYNDIQCGANQRCYGGSCYALAPAPQPQPRPGYCQNDNQCFNNQRCFNNFCYVLAPQNNQVRPGYCTNDNQCLNNQRCFNNYCYISVVVPQLPAGYCTSNAQCGQNQQCIGNSCYILAPIQNQSTTRCPFVPCPGNSECINGVCQPTTFSRPCSVNNQCSDQEICLGNYCRVRACETNMDCFGNLCRGGYCRRR